MALGKQVRRRFGDEPPVDYDHRKPLGRLHIEFLVLVGGERHDVRGGLPQQLRQVGRARFRRELARFEARDVQQILEEAAHADDGVQQVADLLLLVARDLADVAAQQHLAIHRMDVSGVRSWCEAIESSSVRSRSTSISAVTSRKLLITADLDALMDDGRRGGRGRELRSVAARILIRHGDGLPFLQRVFGAAVPFGDRRSVQVPGISGGLHPAPSARLFRREVQDPRSGGFR